MAPILNQEANFSDYTLKGHSLSSLDDEKIIQLILDGHEDAFAELYHRYSADIFNYVLRLVSRPSVAEDLLQDIFIAGWQGLIRFNHNATIKTWLFRIAHNKSMSWMRTFYREPEHDEEDANLITDQISPDDQTTLNWRADILQKALGDLSTNHRAVVELAYFQNLSYAEISEVVDCPIGTVKSRMSHALQNLNGILTNYGLNAENDLSSE